MKIVGTLKLDQAQFRELQALQNLIGFGPSNIA